LSGHFRADSRKKDQAIHIANAVDDRKKQMTLPSEVHVTDVERDESNSGNANSTISFFGQSSLVISSKVAD
jgi:hypothetical protein